MTAKVSILIPVYNVSKYIEQCARSVFRQALNDLEFIFVNDCTPDDSMEKLARVMDDFPQRKNQVRIINHSENRGLAAARITGIEHAQAEYIIAVDSDDYIEPDAIELLYNKAYETGADVVVTDLVKEYAGGKSVVVNYAHSANREDNLLNIVVSIKSPAYLCGKLIRKSLFYMQDFKKLPQGLNYWEDRYVMTQFYFLTEKIFKVEKPLYHYVQYNTSALTSQSKTRMHFENAIYFWNFLEGFLKEQNVYEKYKEIIDIEKVKHKAGMMISTNSSAIRKEFAGTFYEEETHYFGQLKRGKKIITFLIRHKMFVLAQGYHYLVKMYNFTNKLKV